MTHSELVKLAVSGLHPPLELFVHGPQDRYVSQRLRDDGIWEPFETELVSALLTPGAVFADVGANIGYFTLLGAHWVGPDGAVIAVEPDPANAALLRRSLQYNALEGRVTLIQGAFAEQAGEGQLYLSEDNLGDHQTYPESGSARASLSIQTFNGSDCMRGQCERLDLLKVDTQGSEAQVVAGLLPWLHALPSPPQILIELTPFSLREAGSSGRALIAMLTQFDQPFWIVDHIEHRLVPSSANDLAQWCDNVQATPGDRGFMNILVGAGV